MRMINSSNSHKYHTLDSLRGIAALMVCSWHYYLINNPLDILINIKPWLFFNAGSESVLLFFTLSGFVLSSMLNNEFQNHFQYKKYLIRRWLRIYPAFYFAIFLSIIIFLVLRPANIDHLTPWFNSYANGDINIQMIIRSLVLIHDLDHNSFDNVVWSLTIEMLISIIFPLIFILALNKNNVYKSIKNVFIITCVLIVYFILSSTLLKINVKITFYSLQFFLVGIFIFQYKDRLSVFANNKFLVIGVLLYFSRFLTFGKICNQSWYGEISLIGIVLIIINSLYNSVFQKLLSFKILQFYGRISYSFYLLHLPVMYFCVYTLYEGYQFNLFVVKIISFIIASCLASITYRYIEATFINFSKSLHFK